MGWQCNIYDGKQSILRLKDGCLFESDSDEDIDFLALVDKLPVRAHSLIFNGAGLSVVKTRLIKKGLKQREICLLMLWIILDSLLDGFFKLNSLCSVLPFTKFRFNDSRR